MKRCCKIAGLYLATLKAIYTIHQYNHWTATGPGYYGDHLLFQRLYEAAQESLDSAAEKFLGLFGMEGFDFKFQNDLQAKVLGKFEKFAGKPHEMSLAAEKEFLKLSREAYDAFEEDNVMTLGLDDMIMSLASKSEEACYLLQQAMKD